LIAWSIPNRSKAPKLKKVIIEMNRSNKENK
jgi:hypothetical protein